MGSKILTQPRLCLGSALDSESLLKQRCKYLIALYLCKETETILPLNSCPWLEKGGKEK